MVIGGGMMAKAFSSFATSDEVIIFASGVSDSLETRDEAFRRERSLLQSIRDANPGKLLVYFGTCSLFDPERRHTAYVRHKLEMESLLRQSAGDWMVLRLPLVIGPLHRTRTLAQYLYDCISHRVSFDVWQHAVRYPMDVLDVFRVATEFIAQRSFWNRSLCLGLRAFRVIDFVDSLERILGIEARYQLVPKGQYYELNCPEVLDFANKLELDFSDQYLDRVLRKYFQNGSIPPADREDDGDARRFDS